MPDPAAESKPGETNAPTSAPPTGAANASGIAATPRSRKLLPFYAVNLAAVYVPALLPLWLEVRRRLDDAIGIETRDIAIDVLSAPWAGLRFVLDGGVYAFAGKLGSIGSLYAFLLMLWVGVLLASMLYCGYARRLRLTFVLFVLSAVQAVFVAERFVAEHHQPPPEQVPDGGLIE